MRLTQGIKDRIIRKVVEKTFDDKIAEQKAVENGLALKVRALQVSSEELAQMESLPAKFFNTSGCVNAVRQVEGRSNDYYGLSFESGTRIPEHIHGRSVVIEDEALLAELDAWRDRNREIAKERDDFEAQTKGVINSFTSSDKLLEAWPTIGELMGPEYFVEKPKPALPATTINNLDAKLQDARPFETEAVAA